jgi:hypothetical protein
MATTLLAYGDCLLEAATDLTQRTYASVAASGAEACNCGYCQNYVAYREQVFPAEVRRLIAALGIDYRKEVEVFQCERLPNGRHFIGGWFHFKGRMLAAPSRREVPPLDYPHYLLAQPEYISLHFHEDSALSFFEDKTGLVQVEFETTIPWVIAPALDTSS